jgi:hypothetical protein
MLGNDIGGAPAFGPGLPIGSPCNDLCFVALFTAPGWHIACIRIVRLTRVDLLWPHIVTRSITR